MSDDNYKISYLKCQETFLIDVVRRCLEAESKISILKEAVAVKDFEISGLRGNLEDQNSQIIQLLAGLEATTIERDTFREEHARYRDEILSLSGLKEKCDKIEENYENHMKNYNLVNDGYQKLTLEYEQLKSEYEKLQQSDKKTVNKNTPKKDDCQ